MIPSTHDSGSNGEVDGGLVVAVIGLGYVGGVTAACLAELGHTVVGVDVDPVKVEEFAQGRSPIVEPRLNELVHAGWASGRLRVTTELAAALADCDIVLVCVGTPARTDGTVNLDYIERVSEQLGNELAATERFVAVVYRSTVPPGTVDGRLRPLLERASGRRAGEDFGVAMAPEFLREGSGVADFFDPPFSVVGTQDERTLELVTRLLTGLERPVHAMSLDAAESLKYACNAFHAVKVTFANEMARMLDVSGIDARPVMDVFCRDERLNISKAYLRPGFAFGGSCLPKDLRALMHHARLTDVDVPMLNAVLQSNESLVALAVRRVLDYGERDVALLGLSFKAETDDLRESPYVELAERLIGKGMSVKIFDPIVNPQRLIGTNRLYVETRLPHLRDMLVSSPLDALRDASVAIVASSHPDVVTALVTSRPRHVLDLDGRLGADVEALPTYEGIAW